MRKVWLWLGALMSGVGVAVIVAGAIANYMGLSASFNLGDPTKFQFVLIPFWQIGLVAAGAGAGCLLLSRRLKKAADDAATGEFTSHAQTRR